MMMTVHVCRGKSNSSFLYYVKLTMLQSYGRVHTDVEHVTTQRGLCRKQHYFFPPFPFTQWETVDALGENATPSLFLTRDFVCESRVPEPRRNHFLLTPLVKRVDEKKN